MSAYFESINLSGFANWMKVQAKEEVTHALKLYDYLVERGGRGILKTIEASPSEWENPVHVFQNTYEHEKTLQRR